MNSPSDPLLPDDWQVLQDQLGQLGIPLPQPEWCILETKSKKLISPWGGPRGKTVATFDSAADAHAFIEQRRLLPHLHRVVRRVTFILDSDTETR